MDKVKELELKIDELKDISYSNYLPDDMESLRSRIFFIHLEIEQGISNIIQKHLLDIFKVKDCPNFNLKEYSKTMSIMFES